MRALAADPFHNLILDHVYLRKGATRNLIVQTLFALCYFLNDGLKLHIKKLILVERRLHDFVRLP